MKILFATAHQISKEQSSDLEGHEVESLKDVDEDLFSKLVQCPSCTVQLTKLAHRLVDLSLHYDAMIFPIGSPAFQFRFTTIFQQRNRDRHLRTPEFPEIWFSHSVRDSVEIDGIKKSVFIHKKFIKF